MNPYQAYHSGRSQSPPRIEVLLQLYDGIIRMLESALKMLEGGEISAAAPLLLRTRVIVAGLAAGIDPSVGDLPKFLIRLYEFVLHSVSEGGISNVAAALRVLTTLHEGLIAIRPEALRLERDGALPPLDQQGGLRTVA